MVIERREGILWKIWRRNSQNLADNWLDKSEGRSECDDVSLSLWKKNMNSE